MVSFNSINSIFSKFNLLFILLLSVGFVLFAGCAGTDLGTCGDGVCAVNSIGIENKDNCPSDCAGASLADTRVLTFVPSADYPVNEFTENLNGAKLDFYSLYDGEKDIVSVNTEISCMSQSVCTATVNVPARDYYASVNGNYLDFEEGVGVYNKSIVRISEGVPTYKLTVLPSINTKLILVDSESNPVGSDVYSLVSFKDMCVLKSDSSFSKCISELNKVDNGYLYSNPVSINISSVALTEGLKISSPWNYFDGQTYLGVKFEYNGVPFSTLIGISSLKTDAVVLVPVDANALPAITVEDFKAYANSGVVLTLKNNSASTININSLVFNSDSVSPASNGASGFYKISTGKYYISGVEPTAEFNSILAAGETATFITIGENGGRIPSLEALSVGDVYTPKLVLNLVIDGQENSMTINQLNATTVSSQSVEGLYSYMN
jgi:hypothetical protein